MPTITKKFKVSQRSQDGLHADALEEAKRRLAGFPPRYRKFQKRFYNNRVDFVKYCFRWPEGEGPNDYQIDILDRLDKEEKSRIAVRGPHSIGKTAMMAWLVLHYALTRDGKDWKVPTTASVWRQLEKFLWPEIHKWAKRLKWGRVGRPPFNPRLELQTLNLKLHTGLAYAVASKEHTAIEGAQADHMFYIYDEAKAIPDATFDATEGALMGTGEKLAAAFSTPGEPQGRFHHIHSRKPGYEDWGVRHVTLAEAIAAGRISADKAEQRKRQWGAGSAVYQNRVLGEFAASDEDGVIPLAWVEAANDRWREWVGSQFPNLSSDIELMEVAHKMQGEYTTLGVDVGLGGEGSDSTVLAPIIDRFKVVMLRKYPRGDVDTATMETVGRVKGFLNANRSAKAYIDIIGIGAGVVHRLKELSIKLRVFGFNVAQAAKLPSGIKMTDNLGELTFKNKRSAMWWKGREMLSPDSGVDVHLPPDDKLTGDLTAVKRKTFSGGVIHVEEKKETIKRIKRSTDDGDATLMGLTGDELARSPDTEMYMVGDSEIYEGAVEPGAESLATNQRQIEQHIESDEGEYYIVGGKSKRGW